MSTYRFDDWYPRQYDDPRIGRIEPGDTRELDDSPADGRWTLLTESVVSEPDEEDESENPDNENANEDGHPDGEVQEDTPDEEQKVSE